MAYKCSINASWKHSRDKDHDGPDCQPHASLLGGWAQHFYRAVEYLPFVVEHPGTFSTGSKFPLQAQSGCHKCTYTLVTMGCPWVLSEGDRVHIVRDSNNHLGWFSYLSLRNYLATISVSTGKCDIPALARIFYYGFLSIYEIPACQQLGIILTLVPTGHQPISRPIKISCRECSTVILPFPPFKKWVGLSLPPWGPGSLIKCLSNAYWLAETLDSAFL